MYQLECVYFICKYQYTCLYEGEKCTECFIDKCAKCKSFKTCKRRKEKEKKCK